jgi:hypothetical protein
MMRRLSPAALACACLMLFAPLVGAQARDQRTLLTFDQAVEIPNGTLEAGSYEFRLADSRADRHIVQVWNETGTELVATLMAVPEHRRDAADEVLVSFAGGEAGTQPALRAWFYPGERTGHRFVYPHEQAQRIADRTREDVLAADAESLRPDRIDQAQFEMVNERGERAQYDGATALDRQDGGQQDGAGIATRQDERMADVPPAERSRNLCDDRTWHDAPATRDQQPAQQDARAAARDDEAATDQEADLVTQPRRGAFVGPERDDVTERDEIFGDERDQRQAGLGANQGDVTDEYELTRAKEHLRRVSELADRLLFVGSVPAGEAQRAEQRPQDERGVVGTSGAVGTAGRAVQDGERVTLSRDELEELRAHALQAQEALRALAGQNQAQPSGAAPQQR